MSKLLPVIEIFGPTIQGEGMLAGKLSHFVRFGGCPLRCSWCDSMHAVDPGQIRKHVTRMSETGILEKLDDLMKPDWVTLSGGEPAMWDLGNLVKRLQDESNFYVAVETAGVLFPNWLAKCDLVSFSPKPPSAGNEKQADIGLIKEVAATSDHQVSVKIVVFDMADFYYAKDVFEQLPHYVAKYISIGTPRELDGNELKLHILDTYRKISEQLLDWENIRWARSVTVLPQLHVLMWAHQQGV